MTDERVVCAECGSSMILRETKKFPYKDGSPRKFWGCSQWPECKGTHGAHPDGQPLGVPADCDTKKVRRKTHLLLDEWAAGLGLSQKEAYAELKEAWGVEVHIGELDIGGCERLQRFFENESVKP